MPVCSGSSEGAEAHMHKPKLPPPQPRWLIVEWKAPEPQDHTFHFVAEYQLSSDSRHEDLYTGKTVEVMQPGAAPRKANIVMVSGDQKFLEMEFRHLREVNNDIGISRKRSSSTESENGDFEESDTDWAPSQSDFSEIKKKKRRISSKKAPSAPKIKQLKNHFQSKKRNRISDILHKKLTTPPKEIDVFDVPIVQNDNDATFFNASLMEGAQRLNSEFQQIPPQYNFASHQIPPMTFDQRTQTDPLEVNESSYDTLAQNQKLMKSEMVNMYKIIDDMAKQMNTFTAIAKNVEEALQAMRQNQAKQNSPPNDMSVYDFEPESSSVLNDSKMNDNNQGSEYGNDCKNFVIIDGAEMVPIGSGKTLIPLHSYNQIKWNSFTSATRKLLMAVFPRRTLATHSLTGKSSPAFTDRPAKMKLDAKKISDIVMTVSRMCNVQENQIRNAITTKCSDENKMYRQRQQKRNCKNLQETENQENRDPDIEDELTNEE